MARGAYADALRSAEPGRATELLRARVLGSKNTTDHVADWLAEYAALQARHSAELERFLSHRVIPESELGTLAASWQAVADIAVEKLRAGSELSRRITRETEQPVREGLAWPEAERELSALSRYPGDTEVINGIQTLDERRLSALKDGLTRFTTIEVDSAQRVIAASERAVQALLTFEPDEDVQSYVAQIVSGVAPTAAPASQTGGRAGHDPKPTRKFSRNSLLVLPGQIHSNGEDAASTSSSTRKGGASKLRAKVGSIFGRKPRKAPQSPATSRPDHGFSESPGPETPTSARRTQPPDFGLRTGPPLAPPSPIRPTPPQSQPQASQAQPTPQSQPQSQYAPQSYAQNQSQQYQSQPKQTQLQTQYAQSQSNSQVQSAYQSQNAGEQHYAAPPAPPPARHGNPPPISASQPALQPQVATQGQPQGAVLPRQPSRAQPPSTVYSDAYSGPNQTYPAPQTYPQQSATHQAYPTPQSTLRGSGPPSQPSYAIPDTHSLPPPLPQQSLSRAGSLKRTPSVNSPVQPLRPQQGSPQTASPQVVDEDSPFYFTRPPPPTDDQAAVAQPFTPNPNLSAAFEPSTPRQGQQPAGLDRPGAIDEQFYTPVQQFQPQFAPYEVGNGSVASLTSSTYPGAGGSIQGQARSLLPALPTHPGLVSSVLERVSASFEKGKLAASQATGEIVVQYNQVDASTRPPSSQVVVSALGPVSDLEPTSVQVQQLTANTFEFPAPVGYVLELSKYTVASPAESVPLKIVPQWRIEPKQTRLMLSYTLADTWRGPDVVEVHDLTVVVKVNGGHATAAQSKPMATFSRERQRVTWRFSQPVALRRGQVQRLLCQFSTESEAQPAPVDARFTVPQHRPKITLQVLDEAANTWNPVVVAASAAGDIVTA